MSFSLKVKTELYSVMPEARHCRIAELSALISMCGHIYTTVNGRHYFIIMSENRNLVVKTQTLIHKIFGYKSDSAVRYNIDTKNITYITSVMESDAAVKILMAAKLMDVDGSIDRKNALVNMTAINNMCCKRAFLRGTFLAGGSISDPEKSYHFEIVASAMRNADQIMNVIKSFDLDAKIVERRQSYVVYLKEGSQIVDMLNIMGAYVSLMDMENLRVLKEVRNSVNRQVNCETANLGKTISAAVKQIEDINYIKETVGLESLNDGLFEIAKLRLEFPDIPLKELGTKLYPEVGKSGVNHRLRKIGQIADELRQR